MKKNRPSPRLMYSNYLGVCDAYRSEDTIEKSYTKYARMTK